MSVSPKLRNTSFMIRCSSDRNSVNKKAALVLSAYFCAVYTVEDMADLAIQAITNGYLQFMNVLFIDIFAHQ